MAGREISSTLRNLKFMQRAVQKEEKKKEVEEVASNGGFGSSAAVRKKCVVIMEGDPHPGAVKGRMSFQRFNPSIDKLADELDNSSRDPGARTPSSQNDSSMNVERRTNEDNDASDIQKDLKRKQSISESEETQYPNKSPKNVHSNRHASASATSSSKKGSNKKHEKNNWSVLRPPKGQSGRK
ncbi:hypothetical protein QQ045_017092 [Rhodiola kirilowii]